jgi:hypothetical protein
MDLISGHFDFPAHSGSGPQSARMRHAFERRIGLASVVLTGFQASFRDGDHNFGRLTVELQHRIVNESTTGHEVEVTAAFGLRDLSNDWDDAYAGKVSYCLMVIPERREPIGPVER